MCKFTDVKTTNIYIPRTLQGATARRMPERHFLEGNRGTVPGRNPGAQRRGGS